MVIRADAVAQALRSRLPGVPAKKLHKLLYYCQGHHLAVTDQPLFLDQVSAWDMGPVIGGLWRREREGDAPPASAALGERELNTVGYVVSRYGGLTGRDLERLTHAEPPWRQADEARPAHGSAVIGQQSMQRFFADDVDEADSDGFAEQTQLRAWLAGAGVRRSSATPDAAADDTDELRRRLGESGRRNAG